MRNYEGEPTFPEVLRGCRRYVAQGHDEFEIWRARWDVSKIIGYTGNRFGELSEKFLAQTLRAFGKLADEGVLIKVGKDGRLPGGGFARTPTFFLPRTYAAREERGKQQAAAQEAIGKRWADVRAALIAHGFVPHAVRGVPLGLDLDGWEKLVTRLGHIHCGLAGHTDPGEE